MLPEQEINVFDCILSYLEATIKIVWDQIEHLLADQAEVQVSAGERHISLCAKQKNGMTLILL